MKALVQAIFSRKKPYETEIRRLEEAIARGVVGENQKMKDCRVAVEKAIRWHSIFDGGDLAELEIEARERKMVVTTVKDFLNLLRAINSEGG